ncbi:hypothetical protein [Rudaea sp.]|uniref:hypothetical protein n=1 Tax=Rudaea sp. TaxID=2136325 RepID=UPI0037843CF7
MTAGDTFDALAVREAVLTLGYLIPSAEASIVALLQVAPVEHPRAVCTRYRKTGEQLSRDEKRALGLRSNAFLSRQAFNELTPRGRSVPLQAHEVTLLRAEFTRGRRRVISTNIPADVRGFEYFKHDPSNGKCPACQRLKAMGRVQASQVQIMPPVDCAMDACNLCVSFRVDFMALNLGPRTD